MGEGRKEASKNLLRAGAQSRVLRKEGGKSHHHFWRLAGAGERKCCKKGEHVRRSQGGVKPRGNRSGGGQMVLIHHN